MTNELFEKIANEIKSQITKLNLQDKFMLFKADEFAFKNNVVHSNKGNYYILKYVMEIHHPLTGYRVVIDSNIDDVEIAAAEIVAILVKDFTEYYNNK